MIGSITPLVQGAQGGTRWGRAMVAYGVGSAAASAAVGAALGGFGAILQVPTILVYATILAAALVFALGELGLPGVPRPTWRRQTRKMWRQQGGPTRSAFWWGVDIGTGLTTRVTYRSLWIVFALCFASANAVTGAMLMLAYGIGRELLVVTGPALLDNAGDIETLVVALSTAQSTWHRTHAAMLGVVAVGIVGLLWPIV